MLEGSPVNLVNSRATRQVSGRKSDGLDGLWIWPLITYSRLKGVFRSANEISSLRSVVRQRAAQVQEQSRCVPHRQKALIPINTQLDNVVSDLTGKTGPAILHRIVAGERNPGKLSDPT